MLKSGLETKFSLKIKGLIIVLSVNHQLMQSAQTVWEDLQADLTESWRLKTLCWERCCLLFLT